MYILFKKKYGRVEPGTLMNGRKEFYNKLLKGGYCWDVESVEKAIKVFNTQRPRPKQTLGQFCHEWLKSEGFDSTDAKQTTVQPKTKPTTTTAKKKGNNKKL